MVPHLLLCCVLITSASQPASPPWHHPLALGGGGYWSARLRIEVKNDGPTALAGDVVACPIQPRTPTAALIGAAAQQLRVVGPSGVDVLFELLGPDGTPDHEAAVQANSTLVIPAVCGPAESARYYVYFQNPWAGPVPDFLSARPGLVNGSVEVGAHGTPVGWEHDEPDQQHRTSWVRQSAHSGDHCLKTVVNAGAEPTWIGTRQRAIHLNPGARYRFQAWVRAESVIGTAGWFLHIGTRRPACG